jgi:hypothetical protein
MHLPSINNMAKPTGGARVAQTLLSVLVLAHLNHCNRKLTVTV